jgi:uncharacterized membrane protein YhaH (DUF805 family)
MNNKILIALAVLAGLMNPVAALIADSEHQKNSEPVMLTLFVIPWLVGAFLVHRGRRTAGAIVLGLFALLTLLMAPTWKRTSAADWSVQAIASVAAVGVLVGAVALLVQRFRTPKLSGALR